jgi:hypothetical protein
MQKANPAVELAHDCCYPNIKQDYIILAFQGKLQLHQAQDLTSE